MWSISAQSLPQRRNTLVMLQRWKKRWMWSLFLMVVFVVAGSEREWWEFLKMPVFLKIIHYKRKNKRTIKCSCTRPFPQSSPWSQDEYSTLTTLDFECWVHFFCDFSLFGLLLTYRTYLGNSDMRNFFCSFWRVHGNSPEAISTTRHALSSKVSIPKVKAI